MLSTRIKKITRILVGLGQRFGSCSCFVDENFLFKHVDDPAAQKKMSQGYNSILFWAIASFTILIKYYRLRDDNRFNLTIFFWFVGVAAAVCYSIFRWFQKDFVQLINWLTNFIRQFQGTYLHKTLYCNPVKRHSLNIYVGYFFVMKVHFMPKFNSESNMLNYIIDCIIFLNSCGWIITCSFVCVLIIYNPREAIFLGELIPKAYYSYYP